MKPSVSVWTTSQLRYDQRILRMIAAMESVGMEVVVWDRQTGQYPCGKIKGKWSSGPRFYLEYNYQISRLVREVHSDMHYAADIDVMPGLMHGLRRKKKVPLLLDLHEWYPEVIELEGKPLKKRIWQWVEEKSVKRATECMTVNHSLSRIFEKKYGKSFAVVRNVPDPFLAVVSDPMVRLKNKILYYQGALNEGRGLRKVIDWMEYLPEWRLWLAGDGDIAHELREKVRQKGLADRVVFYGRLAPEELPRLAGQATIGLNLLSGDSRSYYYSLANKYFDYIHCGLPGIHMDFPEYIDLMKEYRVGELLRDLSSEAFVNLVHQMTRSPERYIKMTERCDQAALEYNWEKESLVLRTLLEKIAGHDR